MAVRCALLVAAARGAVETRVLAEEKAMWGGTKGEHIGRG
jgi:hypothetical protein